MKVKLNKTLTLQKFSFERGAYEVLFFKGFSNRLTSLIVTASHTHRWAAIDVPNFSIVLSIN